MQKPRQSQEWVRLRATFVPKRPRYGPSDRRSSHRYRSFEVFLILKITFVVFIFVIEVAFFAKLGVAFDLDPFDLICHIAFDAKPLTRKERADNVLKRDVFTKYGPQARAVLEALLEKYSDDGVISIDDPKILKINPFSGMGTEVELIRAFGKKNDYIRAVHEMQTALYEESA